MRPRGRAPVYRNTKRKITRKNKNKNQWIEVHFCSVFPIENRFDKIKYKGPKKSTDRKMKFVVF